MKLKHIKLPTTFHVGQLVIEKYKPKRKSLGIWRNGVEIFFDTWYAIRSSK